ncbi:MAG: hypothetical protein J1F36_05310 [Clostridiales bacterium]|nr:hypothetical protein [Clostridiales bacterium]
MNIIDIGSNSVRLFDGKKKTVITTRLAENMISGVLDTRSIERTVDAIKSLSENADGHCLAFATEAVRKATNKADFIEAVKAQTGITIDVLSGEQEAEISYMGATFGFTGSAAVIDLGGASCEIIFGNSGKITYKASFPFGCVTMKDKFNSDLSSITDYVNSLLADIPSYSAGSYIAVGGTATALAAMAQDLLVYDPNKVDGYKLEANIISRLIDQTMSGKAFPTLQENRRKTIVQGATALKTVISRLGQNVVTVSEKDNLEGYALKHNLM